VKRWTIYCHTHVESGRRYIGLTSKTMERRWQKHVYAALRFSNGGRWHFPNAIRKYGKEAFSHEVLAMSWYLEGANATEEALIEQYDTRNPEFGFNFMKGGLHTPHLITNPWNRPEYRAKSILAANDKWKDPEYRKKSVLAFKNRWKDLAYRSKLSLAIKNKLKDPEYREKLVLSSRGKWLDPVYRTKNMTAAKAGLNTLESKAKISLQSKIKWENPEYRKKQLIRLHDPILKEKVASKLRILNETHRKTHCKNGHEYTPENTYYPKYVPGKRRQGRKCKICERIRRNG